MSAFAAAGDKLGALAQGLTTPAGGLQQLQGLFGDKVRCACLPVCLLRSASAAAIHHRCPPPHIPLCSLLCPTRSPRSQGMAQLFAAGADKLAAAVASGAGRLQDAQAGVAGKIDARGEAVHEARWGWW